MPVYVSSAPEAVSQQFRELSHNDDVTNGEAFQSDWAKLNLIATAKKRRHAVAAYGHKRQLILV
jgi:hypothetical protein